MAVGNVYEFSSNFRNSGRYNLYFNTQTSGVPSQFKITLGKGVGFTIVLFGF